MHQTGEQTNLQWAHALEMNQGSSVPNSAESYFLTLALLHRIRNHEIAEEDGELKTEEAKQSWKQEIQQAIQEAYRRTPHEPALLAYRLEESLAEGDVESAREFLENWPEQERTDARYCRYDGWLKLISGDLEGAETSFRRGLKQNPYDWRTRHLLADGLRQQMKFDEAEKQVHLGLQSIDIRRKVMQLKSLDEFDLKVMNGIMELARAVGDQPVEQQLQTRMMTYREMQGR